MSKTIYNDWRKRFNLPIPPVEKPITKFDKFKDILGWISTGIWTGIWVTFCIMVGLVMLGIILGGLGSII